MAMILIESRTKAGEDEKQERTSCNQGRKDPRFLAR
jgi:hypothetical protein